MYLLGVCGPKHVCAHVEARERHWMLSSLTPHHIPLRQRLALTLGRAHRLLI